MAYDFSKFKKNIDSTKDWLKREFQNIRTGQASPAILDAVKVDAYGNLMPLREIANINIEGAQTLRITPWDNSQIKEIEKSIVVMNLGVSVSVDDKGLRVIFPSLTSDRRQEIAKQAKEKLEEGKKQIRQFRDDVMKDLQIKEKEGGYGKDEIFRWKNETQKIVDDANLDLDKEFLKKEKEIIS